MEIVALSDLHGTLPMIDKPAEIMIIAGDISPLSIQSNIPAMKEWLLNDFVNWIIELPVNQVYLVAGNHDFIFQSLSNSFLLELFLKTRYRLIYLENECAEYVDKEGDKWNIFGTPYCHIFGNWPFMLENETLKEKLKKIPDNIDILISHDTPFGACDICLELDQHLHRGSVPLRNAILEKSPKTILCGHLHSGNHKGEQLGDSMVYNVSLKNESYECAYFPLYLNINKSESYKEKIIEDYKAFKKLSEEHGIDKEEDIISDYLESQAFYDLPQRFVRETIYNYIKNNK